MDTAGKRFRDATRIHAPLPIVGAINAYSAMLAERAGFEAIYLSGAGVANASYGLPDLAITNLNDVLTDVDRITQATKIPLLVDIDTGWGSRLTIARATKALISRGCAGLHIEDQTFAKRCGHRPGKSIVPLKEMVDRVKAAVDARQDPDFVIMARTDAFAKEGLASAIERAQACVAAGADMIFPEALTTLSEYKAFVDALSVPVLANITEFGQTPLFSRASLGRVGVGCVLYPLSAFRAMNRAAESVYRAIYAEGSQESVVSQMQTREELYEVLRYHDYEKTFDTE